jgi:hypothetical protein
MQDLGSMAEAAAVRGMAYVARRLVHDAVTSPNHVSNGQAASWRMRADSDLEAQPMAMWRIRINLADDARSRARLNEVLAKQQVSAIRLTPRAGAEAELSGDVVLELPRDEELGEMLTALHAISPQVFISRASHDRLEACALR